MNSAHIHLLFNHVPLAGMLFSIPLLAFAWWRKSDIVALIGLITVFISGLICIPTFLTGEPAEEIIEHSTGASENLIEKLIKLHEEAAEKAIWVIGISAAIALIGLILRSKNKVIPQIFVSTTLLLSICSD
ncbi:MAG: hypothetical protein ACOYL6_08475 [Bacteriovoracaceae bacterium]